MKYGRLKAYYAMKRGLIEELGRDPTEEELDTELATLKKDGRVYTAREFEAFEIDEEDEASLEVRFKISAQNMSLVRARLEKGLDQKDLDKFLGIGSQTYSSIERMNIYPSDELQEKIANFFGKPKIVLFPAWLKVFTMRWKERERDQVVKIKDGALGPSDNIPALMDPQFTRDQIDRDILAAKLAPILDDLSPREKKILSLRFGLNGEIPHDLDEVGKVFDVTRERIRQIEAKALEKIYMNRRFSELGMKGLFA